MKMYGKTAGFSAGNGVGKMRFFSRLGAKSFSGRKTGWLEERTRSELVFFSSDLVFPKRHAVVPACGAAGYLMWLRIFLR